jgi:hypothetical protein
LSASSRKPSNFTLQACAEEGLPIPVPASFAAVVEIDQAA